ncbi:FAD-binding oxidoreductase [Roseovarius spongiae]|uniref:FAD-binding oxidoreductase n=1 Tax=Roseovarius spongiae TaxID=2320272 RepID=A0A3A8AX74_9RHOB|nr:FAD-binding oxidoreductase [Roseovarius spongiae]RKF16326.1 FAD-binding oxidoreductase [Roseovarius spongiae]
MADVTVRGAGIFGLSVAWSCARRGARVRVIDPCGPGAGASGGIVGALAPHVPEQWNTKKAFQLDSLLMAETYWTEIRAIAGRDPGYARLGRLQPITDDAALALARDRAEGARALWGERATWEVVKAADKGWTPQSPTGLLIRDTLSARIHPRRACAALAAAIMSRGGEVVTDAPDEGRVVWATGAAGLAALSAAHTRSVGAGVKGQAALLAFDADVCPQIFAGGVHVVPHADGTVAVGSTSERDFADATATDAQLDAVIAAARAAVPALADAPVVQRWAGLRPRSRSRAPMLGAHPLHDGQFIANGGFKIGFGMAPKAGEVMADLVLDGVDAIPKAFRPEASF